MFNKKLKLTSLSKGFIGKAALALIALALLITFGCGKRRAPLPPIERVPQRVEISGFQRGSVVNLFWNMPVRNAPDGSVLNIDKVEVYRLAEPLNSTLNLTEDEFASRSTLIAEIPISDADFAKKQITYTDQLSLAGQAARLRYSIRFVNASGQKAAFSNYLLIEPAAKVAEPPSLSEVKTSEDALLLKWTAPTANIDQSKPANILGYNIYRKAGDADFKLLNNNVPITKTDYSDNFFDFDVNYTYLVRTVSLGNNGEPIESSNSNSVSISPKDIFAPSAPSAITIAASPNTLSIFFAVNPEKDIVGYRIYRTTNSSLPKAEWQLLTKDLLTTNTFQDTKVESGKTYFYYLVAVDKAGNISNPSEVVSETAP